MQLFGNNPVNMSHFSWPYGSSVESCSCRVIIYTYFLVIWTRYCDVGLLSFSWMNNKLYWCRICLSYFDIILDLSFTMWSYSLSGETTRCSSTHCKECQTQHSIHNQIACKMKGLDTPRAASIKVIVTMRRVIIRLYVQEI